MLLIVSTLTSVKLLILWSIVNYILNLLPLVFKVNYCIGLLLFFTVEPILLELVKYYSDPRDVISGVGLPHLYTLCRVTLRTYTK